MDPGARVASGFTLIEMAVVVVVIALILGSILIPLNTQVRERNVAETQRKLEETRQALIGYAMVKGRLPRPAESATNGVERAAACTAEAQCTGFVPWITLGTPRADNWGKLIRYSVNSNYAGGASGTATIAAAQFTLTAGARTVKTRDAAGTQQDLAQNVPAVFFSHGERSLGTSIDGTAFPDSPNANADEDANAAAGAVTFYSRSASDNASAPGGEFDDLVLWIPPGQLFTQLVAAGWLP
jgi:prepilin-type N-terminal cleavage/methylation domain-containing protein